MKNIIFHLPYEISKKTNSTSQRRPINLIEAFKTCGYNVDVIEGNAKERNKKIKAIRNKIKNGIVYNFLYSESSAHPTLLIKCNRDYISYFYDFYFFRFCKKKNIKIGLFYRDIFWCFNHIFGNSLKKKMLRWFYKYDLIKYNSFVDVLFVPSLEMTKYIPLKMNMPFYSLPSGSPTVSYKRCERVNIENNSKNLELLYVGGIGLNHDLRLAVKTISKESNVHFTLCCEKKDWNKVSHLYKEFLSDNISIVHKSGDDIAELYAKADMLCLFVNPHQYWEFAVPYKLFEAIGYNCPLITTKNTWVANFCEENNIGLSVDYDENQFSNLLSSISPKQISQLRKNMQLIAPQNTWEARCNYIAKILK